jgi:anti-sigma-K factor RskA
MSDVPMDPMHDLVEEYALGMLDGAELAAFEARLRSDPALQAEVAATLEALGSLAFSAAAKPAPHLKDRVMSQLAVPAPRVEAKVLPFTAPARRSRATIWLGAALAAAIMLVAKLSFDLRDAQAANRSAQVAVSERTSALAQRDSLIAQLTDPAAELVPLAATGDAKPVIKAYVNRARRTMMLSAAQLETLPAGKAYQLWFIVDGKPVPSITFKSDSAGRALLKDVAMPAGAVAAAAITLEPDGGSPAPTSPVLFVGKLATE